MHSRTEMSHENRQMRRKNLPRGYFKKRKYESENMRPPDSGNAKMTQNPSFSVNLLDCVHMRTFAKYSLLILIITWTKIIYGDATTIEPDLKVLSLEAAKIPILSTNSTQICNSMDIRFEIKELEKLRNCRVVEGNVVILLMDELKEDEFRNLSFPDLVEITGYLMIYRISGIKSLNDLFPNLSVIRGRDLFKDYSLILYELVDLEEIGLTNLQTIERGSVRIEKNDKLCFVDRIDWTLIARNPTGDHVNEKNKLTAHCPLCPSDKDSIHCPRMRNDPKLTLCWNQQHCQIKCNCSPNVPCTRDGKCCDESCIGGCEENNPKKCKACKKFVVGEGDNMECRDSCPEGKFEYLSRRCVTEQQCYDQNKYIKDVPNVQLYIPFNKTCQQGCPQTYVEQKSGNKTMCKVCGNDCKKKCQSKIIDSIAAAQSLTGCVIIEGPLEIQIRSSTKSFDSTNNVVKELENSLSSIEEIQDYLKIARSFPIVSLSFLKNLRIIKGKRLESNKYSLVIWDNQNLQELWEDKTVNIENGKFFFHFNPKLCFYKIMNLAKHNEQRIENYETAQKSNGDKTPCNVTKLEVKVVDILANAALLNWPPLKLEDERSLLSYVVFYIAAPFQNITLWQNRDACGNDGWLVDDVNDFASNDSIAFPLTKLEPYTQYAYYVKAYTLATEKTGAQSDIQYFRTLPGVPQTVTKFKGAAKSSSTIEISWEPPRKVNGKLSHYELRAKALDNNDQILEQRDYCAEPMTPNEIHSKTNELKPVEEKSTKPEIFQKCDCSSCAQSCSKAEKDGDEQRQSAIDFEDEIQDFVYVRNDQSADSKSSDRAKRQISIFPETNGDKEISKKVKDMDVQNLQNERGEYLLKIERNIDPSQTTIEITELVHYTTYQISLRACREKQGIEINEAADDTDSVSCSSETQTSIKTLKKEENDLITSFDVASVASNSSTGTGSIRVTWKPPEYPNGLILSYIIKYKKNDVEHLKEESDCKTHKSWLNDSSHIIKYLSNGNWSVQVAAVSMAGQGNFTDIKTVIINEGAGINFYLLLTFLLAILCGLLIIFIFCFKRYYLTSISNMKLIANVNPDYASIQYHPDSWEVPREKVIQLQELGQGSFGMVYEGIIKDFKGEGTETRCAIKTVGENATDKERISFLNEASVMKQFDTAFVVRLLGVVSQSQPTFVVMELMINGDLKSYLRSHRPEYDNGTEPLPQPPTLRQLIQMAAEIADGMSYLSAKKFVHRDLAARNCMINEDLVVKIGDFGMTRDIYETDYYRKGTKGLLPVRWMSPESLKDGVFTSSSDVFSYGVVLWEMATLASQPYQGLSNDQVLRYVIEGGVMERPENCPDKLYELMRRCWQHRPSARPTFMDIIEMLLDDVNQNFRNVSFFFSKEGQDAFNQQRAGDFAVNISDDVTTPLRQDEEDTTSSVEGNHFLMEQINSDKR